MRDEAEESVGKMEGTAEAWEGFWLPGMGLEGNTFPCSEGHPRGKEYTPSECIKLNNKPNQAIQPKPTKPDRTIFTDAQESIMLASVFWNAAVVLRWLLSDHAHFYSCW